MASPSGALLGPASSALEGAPAAARRPRRRAGAGRPRPRRRAPAPRAPRAGTRAGARAGAPRPRRPPPPWPPRLRAAPRVRWSARLSERLQIASFESAQPTWKHALQAWRRSLNCRLHLDAARGKSGTHVCIGLGRVGLGNAPHAGRALALQPLQVGLAPRGRQRVRVQRSADRGRVGRASAGGPTGRPGRACATFPERVAVRQSLAGHAADCNVKLLCM